MRHPFKKEVAYLTAYFDGVPVALTTRFSCSGLPDINHTVNQILFAVLSEFGYVEPVIWNKTTGHVVGGHQRLKVLIDTGISCFEWSSCIVLNADYSPLDIGRKREKPLYSGAFSACEHKMNPTRIVSTLVGLGV